ncbi:MAG: DoxX family membrane protein [Candidatus Aminicenantes bacterium]|nr:DoxX family membrane protein [Candidatus Aminicenantes bacterium]
MIRNKYLLFFFRLVVGGVFIWAGLLKIMDPLDFAQSIANYRAFPRLLSFFLALILPWIEVFCGLFVISGLFKRSGALVLSVMTGCFLLLITVTIFRGIDIDCGCFGSLSSRVDYKLILEDLVLLFFSINIYISSSKPPS